MKLSKSIILTLSLFIILNSCGTFNEASKVLRNEKTNSIDEFLIKKKGPLTQPPDFEKIPEPSSAKNTQESDQNNIKKILKTNKAQQNNSQTKASSTEESILKKIKK